MSGTGSASTRRDYIRLVKVMRRDGLQVEYEHDQERRVGGYCMAGLVYVVERSLRLRLGADVGGGGQAYRGSCDAHRIA